MGRCKKERCCRIFGEEKVFRPVSIPMSQLELLPLEMDEFEAMRLCDHDGLSQIEAAEKMGVSRGTIQRLLQKARFKIVEAFLESKGLIIKNN